MRTFLWVTSFLLVAASSSRAEVKLAAPFGEHMVLQRDKPIAIFGTAAAGENVTVRFHNQEQRAVTDTEGKWKALLAPLPANGQPAELTVIGGTGAPLVLGDILVGDVWVCSGQSNMAMTAKELPPADAAIALAAHELIRLNNSADKPVWAACTADTAREASALGVLFGERMLAASVDRVPVGIVTRAVGGTEIQRWLDPLSCQADPEFASKNSAKTGKDLYRAQIEPLMPMTIRGLLWYQGEQNTFDGEESYTPRLLNVVHNWRKLWGQGDFPFLIVQLPNINPPRQNVPVEGFKSWMDVRSAQFVAARTLPAVALIVTFDIGDTNAHPINKPAVADRLALAGKAIALGVKGEYEGPMFESVKFEGKRAVVNFTHAASGLEARGNGGKLEGFAVAGADGNFHWADATLGGNGTVMLTSAEVPAPTQIRYAWANNPLGNLYNKDGLPASPFRSDSVPSGL